MTTAATPGSGISTERHGSVEAPAVGRSPVENVFDPAHMAQKEKEYKDAVKRMSDKGAKYVQVELADANSVLRGKVVKIKKIMPTGIPFASALYCLTYGDDLFDFKYGNYQDGVPTIYAVPDLETFVHWTWKPKMSSVLLDTFYEDGTPCFYDPRQVLRKLQARAEAMNLEVRLSVEYECFAFHANSDLIEEGRYAELKPFGRIQDSYALHRFPHFEDLALEFMMRMEEIGIDIEHFHTELGRGALEFTIAPLPALQAADAAMRAKLYLKQLCAEKDLIMSFMSRKSMKEVAAGAHHHMSIWRDGKPALHDPSTNDLSKLGRHLVAGLSATMPDYHLFYRSTINAYRRFNVMEWSPVDNSWGVDNRVAGLRFIKGMTPETYRIENRAPGADVNPYLATCAMIAGGIYGIEKELEAPDPAVGNPEGDVRWTPLPNSLEASVEALRNSEIAREWLTDELVDLMIAKSEAEVRFWDNRPDEEVTTWEYRRYFE